MEKTVYKKWICVQYNTNGKLMTADFETLNWFKTKSIENFTKNSVFTWNQCRSFGWRCIQIEVSIPKNITDSK